MNGTLVLFGAALMFGTVEAVLVLGTIDALRGGDWGMDGNEELLIGPLGCLVGGALFAAFFYAFIYSVGQLLRLFPSERDEHADANSP